MSDLHCLTDEQMARLQPFCPKSHGKPRVCDRRVLSGIVFVNRNGLRWCDAPKDYWPHKTLYNRWKRWGERGVFLRMMEGLAAAEAVPKTVMIDVTYLKAHRTALSPRVKRGSRPSDRPHERRHEHQIARGQRCGWSVLETLHNRWTDQRIRRRGSLARRSAESAVAAWRQWLWRLSVQGRPESQGHPALHPGRNEPVRYDKCRYRRRSRIETMFGRLKDRRRVATRDDSCPTVFFSAVALAATVIFWL